MHCPNCHTPTNGPDWRARTTHLWANQYGDCQRVFCNVCGGWYDVKTLHLRVTVREVHAPESPSA